MKSHFQLFRKKKQPKLTIKAIIRWEQLSEKSFFALDYKSDRDMLTLFYVCSNTGFSTMKEFVQRLKKRHVKRMINSISKQMIYTSQFQSRGTVGGSGEPVFLKDIAPILIMNGMSAEYALNEMEICDIELFAKAHGDIQKTRLIEQRFGIFWNTRPYHSVNIKVPADMYSYEWEDGDKKKELEGRRDKDIEMYNAFMNSDFKIK